VLRAAQHQGRSGINSLRSDPAAAAGAVTNIGRHNLLRSLAPAEGVMEIGGSGRINRCRPGPGFRPDSWDGKRMRLGSIFIALCMMLIAGSVGALLYLAADFDRVEAATIAVIVLTALAIYNLIANQLRASARFGAQLFELGRGSSDLARQVAELGRRLAAIEKVRSPDNAHIFIDPLANEIDELGALTKQLADTAARHETMLTELGRSKPAPAPAKARPDPSPVEIPVATAATPPRDASPAAAPAVNKRKDELLASIRAAVEANRVDLYLQPIVTLPQRKVRYYEGMSRLRTEQGDVLAAGDFVGPAENAGLMPKIDNLVVFRCVQVIRRLLLKNREIGLFCNLSGSTLTDATVFQQLLEFLEANRAIAPAIVLEFTQSFVRSAGPIENESLSALADRGFRFSLDNLRDLRIEPRELAARGFRFVKVPGALLLNRTGTAATDIHPADLSDLLGRFGIDLIAEKIESEGVVVDLLDCDVRFGQGYLFSAPRPVRAEALQGIADRGDVVAQDVALPEAIPAMRPAGEAAASEANTAKRGSGFAQLARRI
jgi:cyclic-di-GMP phosphodiesterase TipF (flagellum assembly factor)